MSRKLRQPLAIGWYCTRNVRNGEDIVRLADSTGPNNWTAARVGPYLAPQHLHWLEKAQLADLGVGWFAPVPPQTETSQAKSGGGETSEIGRTWRVDGSDVLLARSAGRHLTTVGLA